MSISTKLFIPKKLKIGFQKRRDTFTGKLAYVIYYDERNTLRKVKSWDGWRDHSIETLEIDNDPKTGFLFNKGIQRYSDWGTGRAVVRVYDPRDFEFEISMDNLIGILMHSDITKRDIVEPCVFAWAGPELVLLPTNTEEYQESRKYTDIQSNKISTKSLVPGVQYSYKKSDKVATYIGFYPWYELGKVDGENKGKANHGYDYIVSNKTQLLKGNKHIFKVGNSFEPVSVALLSEAISEPVENISFLIDEFFDTINSQEIVGVKLGEVKLGKTYNRYYKFLDDTTIEEVRKSDFYSFYSTYNVKNDDFYQEKYTLSFENKLLVVPTIYSTTNSYNYRYNSYNTYKTYTQVIIPQFSDVLNNLYPNCDNKLSPNQINTIMKELGYTNNFMFVLKDGTEVQYDFTM
jgi:hypothetical protein